MQQRFSSARFMLGVVAGLLLISLVKSPVTTPQQKGLDYKTTFVVSTEKAGQKVILGRVTKEGVFDEYFVPLESTTDERGDARFAGIFVPSTWEIAAGEGKMRKRVTYTIQIKEPTHTFKVLLR